MLFSHRFLKDESESGLALSGTSYRGKLRTARSGRSWLQNLQWCPNGQPDYGIGEGEDDSMGQAGRDPQISFSQGRSHTTRPPRRTLVAAERNVLKGQQHL